MDGLAEGQISIEVSDTLWEIMEDVGLDARRRKIIWPDDQHLTIDQSVRRIQKDHPHFACERIGEFLISWIEQNAPEDYTEEQLEELDRLTEPWVDQYEERLTRAKNKQRTRHC